MSSDFILNEKIYESENVSQNEKKNETSTVKVKEDAEETADDIKSEPLEPNKVISNDSTSKRENKESESDYEKPLAEYPVKMSFKSEVSKSALEEQVDDVQETINKENEWIDLLGSGAIMKKIIKEGKPDTRPERNEKCTVNYICYLEDETIVDNVSDFEVYLGESDVIQGLDVALGLMNLEEKCRLKIEPRLAFGKLGLSPKIPGNAIVIYDIELTAIHPEEDIDTFSVQQRKLLGNKKRERGNWWYTRGENNIAVQCYRRALDYLNEVEGGLNAVSESGDKHEVTDADLQSLLEDRISVCNNMAAAQIKMELYDQALSSLQVVLRCQPNNVKAHFRKAKVYLGKNDLSTAMKCLQKAKELEPNDPQITKEINNVAKMLEKQKVTERELARRMFNGPRKSDDKNTSSKKVTPSKFTLWASLGAAVALGVAGFAAYRFRYI